MADLGVKKRVLAECSDEGPACENLAMRLVIDHGMSEVAIHQPMEIAMHTSAVENNIRTLE